MIVQQLVDYINQERIQGKSEDQIKTALLSAGWAERDIDEALGRSPTPSAQVAPMSNASITRLEFTRTFSLAWDTYKSNFRVLFPLTLLIYLPIDYLTQSGVGNGVYGFVYLFVTVFSFTAYKARITAIPLTIKTVLTGEHINLKLIMGPLLWTWFLESLLNLLLFFLLIIPGIIYLVYWSLSIFVVLDKGISEKKALNYSKDLVKGHWWRVLGVNSTYNAHGRNIIHSIVVFS